MSTITLQNTEFSTVTFDTTNNIGIIDWKQIKQTSEGYKESFTVLIDYIKDKNLSVKFLSDTRKQSVVSPDDRKWFQTVAVPLAQKYGLKRAAVVISGNVFKKYYMNMILMAMKKLPVDIKIFDDVQLAKDWLNYE